MVTIRDIAQRLGIAVSTVSKGLNGAPDVSAETRQLVLDTAVEMGYAAKRARRPVSYTHLDVYKRQIRRSVRFRAATSRKSSWAGGF